MRRVGLTGGIGAGKSSVARLLVGHGAALIDADAVARAVLAPDTEGLRAVVRAFGGEVLAADGSLDRDVLAARVFADASARRTLEGITHPRIGAETARLLAALPPDALVVHDVPLLVELHLMAEYDLVVVVQAPLPVRLQRLAERGLPAEQARERIAAQASDDDRRLVADVLIDNSDDEAALATAVHEAWPRISGFR